MNLTRSRIGSALVAAALTVALTGCGTSDEAPDASPATDSSNPSSSPTESASSSPAAKNKPSPSETPTLDVDPKTGKYDYCKNQKPFTGEAAKTFGADKVMDAYCTYVTENMEQSFVAELVKADPKDLTAKDLSYWERYMTKDVRDDWRAATESVTGPDGVRDDMTKVWALTYIDLLYKSDFTWANGNEPVVFNLSFSPATTVVDRSKGEPRLGMDFKISGDVNVVEKGTGDPYLISLTKSLSLTLVENPTASTPEDEWLIDGWWVEIDSKDAVKRPPLTELGK